jgi:hypothetical protein
VNCKLRASHQNFAGRDLSEGMEGARRGNIKCLVPLHSSISGPNVGLCKQGQGPKPYEATTPAFNTLVPTSVSNGSHEDRFQYHKGNPWITGLYFYMKAQSSWSEIMYSRLSYNAVHVFLKITALWNFAQ